MTPKAQYISASRRNDLPRFHCNRFYDAVSAGEVTYDGGYGRSYTVSLLPDDVLGFIFWSKDYSEFTKHPRFSDLISTYNAIFHFTINDCSELEPGVPALASRLETLNSLCDAVGPERVIWRFDPICRFVDSNGVARLNVGSFPELVKRVAAAGVTRCHFSFMTGYAKLKGRGVQFAAIGEEERTDITSQMLEAARAENVLLFNCCNKEVPRMVPGIAPARCVDDDLLLSTDRFGVHRPLKPKPTREGCLCAESRDIGSYVDPCAHGCVYCYANPLCEATS